MSANGKSKKGSAKRPWNMGSDDITLILFPRSDVEKNIVKLSWEPWEKPRPSLPIDDFLFTARSKLKDRDSLAKTGIYCPYFHTRWGILRGANIAHHALLNKAAIRRERERLQLIKSDIEKKKSIFLDFIEKSHSHHFIISTRTPPDLGLNDRYTQQISIVDNHLKKISEAILALESLGKIIVGELERVPMQKKTAKEWEACFIETLSFTWRDLTDMKVNSKSNRMFMDFVENAYQSIGLRDEIDWSNQLNKALLRTPKIKHNRFLKGNALYLHFDPLPEFL